MDFAMLPPEINSGRMYTGPGSGPMLAAAQAWSALAGDLYSTASSYGSVVSGLTTGPWVGPSSVTMSAAATGYQAWLGSTAAQVDETATQAAAAATAFEAAFAATVPPAEVAANRSLLMALIATNLLGQNTAAIAATEAQYGEMWAQDVVAMFDYAGSSASATQVTPFSPPQQTTTGSGLANQASAVSQAGEAPAGNAQSTLSQIFSAVPNALSSAATSDVFGSVTPIDLLDVGADLVAFGIDAPISPLGVISLPLDVVGAQTGLHSDDIISGWAAAGLLPGVGAASEAPIAAATTAASPMVAAGLGQADTIGALSVPPTWVPATPAVRPVALALSVADDGANSQALTSVMGNTYGDMALANAAGRVVGDGRGARGREQAKAAAGSRPPAPKQDTKAGPDREASESEPRTVVTGIAAEIREFAKLRDDGLMSDEEFKEQRNRLLGRSTG
jgi:PPE-repeat protein